MMTDEHCQLLEALLLFKQHEGGRAGRNVMHKIHELQNALVEDEVPSRDHSAGTSSVVSPAYS